MKISRSTPLDALPAMLRVDELASWWSCSRGVVYGLIRSGTLPHVRLGRLVRIRRDDLVSWSQAPVDGRGRDEVVAS
jgi:excisionase family DNA binding protein